VNLQLGNGITVIASLLKSSFPMAGNDPDAKPATVMPL
jgi:hypothetical protein